MGPKPVFLPLRVGVVTNALHSQGQYQGQNSKTVTFLILFLSGC